MGNEEALLSLLDRYQRDFPLVSAPFSRLAEAYRGGKCGERRGERGKRETQLLEQLSRAQGDGLLSRVGAVFAPNTVGASTLAALSVPEERLDEVAAWVSRQPEVNHNYTREHRYNLWFVLTAENRIQLDATLSRMAHSTGLEPLDLPLEREYHIDLGFPLGTRGPARKPLVTRSGPLVLTSAERLLVAALSDGLPLHPRPFLRLAEGCGWSETALLQRLQAWVDSGVIRRFGFILRHHELGYRANTMCVWQVPDPLRDTLGQNLSDDPRVTLCYGRPARGPHWPYNLFCMIHARTAEEAQQAHQHLNARYGLTRYPQAALISTRRHTQRGARYLHPAREDVR